MAAGAFAIGKCGAYGEAYDYPAAAAARTAALKQCRGGCTAVLTNWRAMECVIASTWETCDAQGYAVEASIPACATGPRKARPDDRLRANTEMPT